MRLLTNPPFVNSEIALSLSFIGTRMAQHYAIDIEGLVSDVNRNSHFSILQIMDASSMYF
ncbi:hypothetical protein [Vibrio litoralis]|uniref:hypothetical protein n=1 Tax=Vibrio litoralis TaxID=335972 RepID=UPI0012EC9E4C|nr:hypothetical protein [Vibrio litoralis]